jgi:hypothetical protein
VKSYLNTRFSIKDLGEASYILGIKIIRYISRCIIALSQSTYIDKILKKFQMDQSKKGFLTMLQNKTIGASQCPLTAEDRENMLNIPYASAIGSIVCHVMYSTRRIQCSLYDEQIPKQSWYGTMDIS